MKNQNGKASTVLIVILLVVAVVLGLVAYKFYTEKNEATEKAQKLETEVASLNSKVDSLQSTIDKISNVIDATKTGEDTSKENDSTKSEDKTVEKDLTETVSTKTIEGRFVPDGDFYTDAGGFIFNKNGEVENYGNFSDYGTYTRNGDILDIVLTEGTDPNTFDRIKLDNAISFKFKIVDDNNIISYSNGSEFNYLRNIDPTYENVTGTWIVKDSNSENEYLKLNADKTYEYSVKQFDGTLVESKGTYSLKDKNSVENYKGEITLKAEDGSEQEINFYGGKYILNLVEKVWEKK